MCGGDGGDELSGARRLPEVTECRFFLLLLLLLGSVGRSWLLCVAATRDAGGDELSGARSLPEVTECRFFLPLPPAMWLAGTVVFWYVCGGSGGVYLI